MSPLETGFCSRTPGVPDGARSNKNLRKEGIIERFSVTKKHWASAPARHCRRCDRHDDFTAGLPLRTRSITERLLNVDKEPGNWLHHHQNYAAHPLLQSKRDQSRQREESEGRVDPSPGWQRGRRHLDAMASLKARRSSRTGSCTSPTVGARSTRSTPMAATARCVWKMDPKTDHDWAGAVACCGVDNRGVALWGNLVISHTLDGRLIATDKETGQVAWQRTGCRSRQGRGHYRRAADREEHGDHRRCRRRVRHPRLDRGDRPHDPEGGLAHLYHSRQGRAGQRNLEGRQERGRERRRFDVGRPAATIRQPTPLSGASAIRVPTGTTRIGRATTSIPTARWRSTPTTGKIKWHYQHTPNDPYDYDSVAENVLVDIPGPSGPQKLALEADRNGFAYAVDRTTRQVRLGPSVRQESHLDQRTRRGDRQADRV